MLSWSNPRVLAKAIARKASFDRWRVRYTLEDVVVEALDAETEPGHPDLAQGFELFAPFSR